MRKGRAADRVRPFVGNRGSGQRFAGSGRVGSRKVTRGAWTTLGWPIAHLLDVLTILFITNNLKNIKGGESQAMYDLC